MIAVGAGLAWHNGIPLLLVTEWIVRRPRWSRDASRRLEVSVGSSFSTVPRHQAHAGSHSRGPRFSKRPKSERQLWSDGFREAITPSPPHGPIYYYSYHSRQFQILNCSFCSAMLHQMRFMIVTGLYDVMCSALYMRHLVWFDACLLHGFPLKQLGDFKNRLYANMPGAIFARL